MLLFHQTVFDETAAKVLGFSANSSVAMTSDEERYTSMSLLRGARVMVTIKKRVKGMYVNYTMSELEVLGGPFSLKEDKEKDDVSTSSPDEETMHVSLQKVQEWVDAYEDDILVSSSTSTCSTASTVLLSGNEGDDNAEQNATASAIVVDSSSSSSHDDTEATVSNVDRIWNRTEAMLNQQTFDTAVNAACVLYTCDEMVHILDLSEDEYYVPSASLIHRLLRWVVIALTERFGKFQWRIDMIEMVRKTVDTQYAILRYAGKGDDDSD